MNEDLEDAASFDHQLIIEDASRGVNIQAGDVDKAIKKMEDKGIQIVVSDEVRKGH